MSDEKDFTVRLDDASKASSLVKFALMVSDKLVKLALRIAALERQTTAAPGRETAGATSAAISFMNPLTKQAILIPSATFNRAGYDNERVGYVLDISGAVGGGIGGTVQGYTLNYGENGGEPLTAGFMGNNEDPTQPRIDVGFKSKRGGQLEMYGSAVEGGTPMPRDGQLRFTVGPTGYIAFFRYIGSNSWRCIGGITAEGRIVAGWYHYGFPGTSDASGTSAAGHPVTVYGEAGTGGANTTTPVAYITKGGVFTGTGVSIGGKSYARTAVLAADGVTTVYALASAT